MVRGLRRYPTVSAHGVGPSAPLAPPRDDVAAFLVALATGDAYAGQAVSVTGA